MYKRQVQLFIGLLVIRFLEKYICTDPGFLEHLILLHSGCRDVDIDPSYSAVLMFDAVYSLDALQNIFLSLIHISL